MTYGPVRDPNDPQYASNFTQQDDSTPRYASPDGAGFAQQGGDGQIPGQGPGKNRDQMAWGGYDGTTEIGPDGKAVTNYGKSGQAADVNRYGQLAFGTIGRGAYQNDYGAANAFAGAGAEAREGQRDALSMSRDVATNGDQIAQQLGQRTLAQGADAQAAGALSVSNDPLAQAGALQQQRGGAASYMQRGNNALTAQRADDMAAGRAAYLSGSSAMRAGDMTAQGLNQRQGIAQGENELDQRGRNDRLEQGYEGLRYGVNEAAQQASIARAQQAAGTYKNDLNVSATNDEQNRNRLGTAVHAVSSTASTATKKKPEETGES